MKPVKQILLTSLLCTMIASTALSAEKNRDKGNGDTGSAGETMGSAIETPLLKLAPQDATLVAQIISKFMMGAINYYGEPMEKLQVDKIVIRSLDKITGEEENRIQLLFKGQNRHEDRRFFFPEETPDQISDANNLRQSLKAVTAEIEYPGAHADEVSRLTCTTKFLEQSVCHAVDPRFSEND